ncbi:SDR family NAD(P)-dependent oxidoreductase [Micromonospora profundi]|uniref:SDR family NAD(P)-dependent oxidoreductase n=1 Tax=Micromonospora profundi TaxID=1420889 RepID=A0AAJ6HVL5_9ACTN|nr:SDR family NAD(P)-dependent oxidoreductase [Micromonospora profundi]WLS45385.1 SDR family NAD(P)-dependent oxidoreductase [Micromonospora profundi]
MSELRTVAITGAASGLGRELALQFTGLGYTVYGTAISAEEAAGLAGEQGIVLSVVDITDDAAVRTWAAEVGRAVGDHGLDILVNNAGILTPGPLEALPIDEVRREFDVNVLGTISATNAFLPLLRAAHGRIVLIGAMTGRFPLQFNGPSSATKAALEAIADVYRNELRPFGVDVVIAQAGNMLTGGPAKTAAALERVASAFTPEQANLYGESFTAFADALNSMQSSGLPAVDAAEWVIRLATEQPAPSRAPVGHDAEDILRRVATESDAQLDALRTELLGPRAS